MERQGPHGMEGEPGPGEAGHHGGGTRPVPAAGPGERPEGLAIWTELCEAVTAVRLSLNRDLQHNVGVSLAENLVLCQVAMAPERRMRMADLADHLMIGKSAVTKTVDRLEQRGLLTRTRDLADRRIVYATLTEEGARLFALAQPAFADAVGRHFSASLSDAELAQLRAASERVLRSQSGRGSSG